MEAFWPDSCNEPPESEGTAARAPPLDHQEIDEQPEESDLTTARAQTATLQPPVLFQSEPWPKSEDDKVGLHEKVEEILCKLGIGEGSEAEDGVQSIVLYGMGGVGKSTLANAVTSKLSSKGFSYAKLEIAQKENDEGRMKLEEFVSNLDSRSEPVLLFIDNILKRSDVEKLLPEKLNLPNRSCLIFTTRDESVSMVVEDRVVGRCQSYCVRSLEYPEAKELLLREVFKEKSRPAENKEAFDNVLKLCGGLPLAVKSVGRYLNHHNTDSGWKFVIKKLKNLDSLEGNKDDLLNEAIYFNYNQIDLPHKNAFLDIACLLRDQDWIWAKHVFEDGDEIVEKLEQLGLVEKDDYRRQIHVHDLLVTLAKKESSHKRLSYGGGDELPDDPLRCGEVEGLFVKSNSQIQAQKLDAMLRSLRFLILEKGVELEGKCSQTPSELQFFYTRVGFPFKSIADLHKLKVLMVENGDFENEKLLIASDLEVLDLIDCKLPRSFPITVGKPHSLAALKELKLWNCNLTVLPEDFSGLSSLEALTLGCGMRSELQTLPAQFGKLVALKKLELWTCESLTVLPEDFSALSSLEELRLHDCVRLQSLPTQFGKLAALKELTLWGCHSLTVLPKDFSELSSLESLTLSKCKQLQTLPTQFGKLALKELHVWDCESLKVFPEDISGLSSLDSSDLWGITQYIASTSKA